VLSYNVLANAYVRREWYSATLDSLLAPGARTAALAARIAGFDAEVICLQEVEEDVFGALAATLAGYRGQWLQKGAGKPDGCATFSRLLPGSFARLRYTDETGHVALIAVVKLGGRRVAIANTHARWSPPETPPADHLGGRQLLELVERRSEVAPDVDDWLICGDLNTSPESDAIQRLLDAGFVDCFADQPHAYTCNSNGAPKRIDFILATAGLDHVAIAPPVITADTALPSDIEPSDHLPIAVDLRRGRRSPGG
jgi:mRNA deadenylase 3'-5' endonuclease subunit Ccr4